MTIRSCRPPRAPAAAAPRRAGPAATALLAVLLLAAVPTRAQDGDPAARAQALLQEQRFAEAAEVLAELAEANPDSPQAWFLLGYALHADGRYEQALEAHARAAGFPAVAPNAAYNAACAAARLGRTDAAFEWLDTAVQAGWGNLAQARADADLAGLADDPRFLRFGLPAADQAAVLFVEEADVRQVWNGEAGGDTFGWIARNVGDLDGDGADDAALSAPYHRGAGRVYAYSGRSGALLWTADGQPGDTYGLGIEAAGDVDGDGVPDVAAGAPRKDGAPGRVEVLSGVDGRVLLTCSAGEANDGFGAQVQGCGDRDGDGHGDLWIGAPRADVTLDGTTLTDAGRLYLCSGADGSVLASWDGSLPQGNLGVTVAAGWDATSHELMAGSVLPAGGEVIVLTVDDGALVQRFRWQGPASAQAYGNMFLSRVGDVDADGVQDLYVSDWQDTSAGPTTGRVEVRSGADGRVLHALAGDGPGQGFGIGSAQAGDVDGDGHDDLVIGSWVHPAGAPRGGRVTLFSGASGAVLHTWTCRVPGETFGYDACHLGDVDGDGRREMLLTSASSPAVAPNAGRVFVISVPADLSPAN